MTSALRARSAATEATQGAQATGQPVDLRDLGDFGVCVFLD